MQWFIRNYRFIQSIRTTVASVSIVLASLAIAQTQDSTLYIAQLRAQNGVNSSGSGTATLRLSGDETSAIVAFSYSNLTSPITGLHIHGPADQVRVPGFSSMLIPPLLNPMGRISGLSRLPVPTPLLILLRRSNPAGLI
jgi:hypothetical protein